jgi:cytidine deaminase
MSSRMAWEDALIQQALQAMQNAYAPYSHFQVGAALLTESGAVVEGCNVENCSYGLTICAERTAAVSAVAQGLVDWKAIAIASVGGVAPCGACRQFLAEFAPNLIILLVDSTSEKPTISVSLTDLLPNSFTPARLPSRKLDRS